MHGRYISGYPGQDECCSLQESIWNILEAYVLKDTPSTTRVAFSLLLLRARALNIVRERDTGRLQSMNASLNSTDCSLHDKRPTLS